MAMLPNYYYFIPKVKWTDGAAVVTLEDHSEADVVEVVRCPSCKFHEDIDGYHECKKLRMRCPNDAEFFCKYGQRREEEHNAAD